MKHKFEGIGETTAVIIMAGLALNPSTQFLANGILGKIVFRVAKYFSMVLASKGLILINIGAAKVAVLADESNYNGSWDQAEELIKKIRENGRELTDEEIKEIDAPVIDAFRKFASFGKLRKRGDTEL